MIYTYSYLFYIPITLIFGSLLTFYGIKSKKEYPYFLCVIGALLYVNMAVKIAVFPLIVVNIPGFDISHNINWRIGIQGAGWKHYLLNVLLTFPIGFGMQFIFDTTMIKRIFLCVVCGLSFELCQLALLLTIKPLNVVFDVNDLISNAAGVLIGLLLIQAINLTVRKIKKPCKNSILTYFFTVCQRS